MGGLTFADAYNMQNISTEKSERLGARKVKQAGGGLYPVFSLLNHSCDPNCSYFVAPSTGGTMIVFAHRSLKKGEIFNVPYISDIDVSDHSGRRRKLRNNFYFKCDCIACDN